MSKTQTIEVPIKGMDCAECTQHVRQAISSLPGVESVEVFLAAEKARVKLDSSRTDVPAIRRAVASAGYSVPATANHTTRVAVPGAGLFLAVIFFAVLLLVVVGEWLGLIQALTTRVPFSIGVLLVIAAGWPIFRNVVRAALKRQVISHTLMTLGVLAALAVGQWATAAVVVFFMRLGSATESFTTERAGRAVKNLAAMAPQNARIEQDGQEREVPITEVLAGSIVIVRPGELIPVDGQVIAGQATIDQSTITGEAMPVEAGVGSSVYAATVAQLGSLRIRVVQAGAGTTFGRVIKLVEEAESHRAGVQRFADRFTQYYLPVVAGIAALTLIFRHDPLATAAVLVVACSCSIALATPIAMLASIGASARRGILVKGGKYLEILARADTLLIDKTGTLTLGQPRITDIVALDGLGPDQLLALAASAERYSEHPLAEAVRLAARERGLALVEPDEFEAIPGRGVSARVLSDQVTVGSSRTLASAVAQAMQKKITPLTGAGKSLIYVGRNGVLTGVLAAADELRPEVPEALRSLRALGIRHIELLTGDNELTAAALASRLGVAYRANLLPEDKIAIVREYQARGKRVVMIGDGVNDAPALAAADVGIAMGAMGADIAIEAAHVVLLREDWLLVPQLVRIARRTMRVVVTNLALTAVYNVVGLLLAAFGFLPPILAAAAQSLPDLGLLANSMRLLRQPKT